MPAPRSDTWTDYATALATVQAGNADGISYVLTEEDPFAAIDLDHCRHVDTHSIDVWAQNFLDLAVIPIREVTPSGAGCRIWGLASGAALHRKFTLEIDGKPIAAELFRRTRKALTITGYRLDTIRELTSIDKVLDWGVIWGERRKAAAAAAAPVNGHSFNGSGSGHSVDQIEQIVRKGAPAGANRSDIFHTVVGHYLGCGWTVEQILAHLQQFPHGISDRYLREGRLHREIARSASKYAAAELPLSAGLGRRLGGQGTAAAGARAVQPGDDPELEEPLRAGDDPGRARRRGAAGSSSRTCRRCMHTATRTRARSRAGW